MTLEEEFVEQIKQEGKSELISEGKLTHLVNLKVTHQIGKIFGESKRTVMKRLYIVKAAKDEPERYQPFVEEMDKTGKVENVYNKLDLSRIFEDGKPGFNVILVDTPWPRLFIHKKEDEEYGKRFTFSIKGQIPPKELCGVIKRISHKEIADNAVLFLWVTNLFAGYAFEIVKSMGFTYRRLFVWVKDKLKSTSSVFYDQYELLYICTKGSFSNIEDEMIFPISPANNDYQLFSSIIKAEEERMDSRPDVFYEIIERLFPGGNYLELFSNSKRKGWTSKPLSLDYEVPET